MIVLPVERISERYVKYYGADASRYAALIIPEDQARIADEIHHHADAGAAATAITGRMPGKEASAATANVR